MFLEEHKTARGLLGLSAIFIALLSIGSCAPRGENSLSEIDSELRASGLSYAGSVGLESGQYPFTNRYSTLISLSAEASRPDAIEDAVDYMFRLAWAQGETRPTDEYGEIALVAYDGTTITPCGLVRKKTGDADRPCGSINDDMTYLYGGWPGPLPDLPGKFSIQEGPSCRDQRPGPYGEYACEQIARIIDERIVGDTTNEGVPFEEGVYIEVMPSIDPGEVDIVIDAYRVEPERLDYLLRLAWAQTSAEPTGGILLLQWSHFPPSLQYVDNDIYADEGHRLPCEGGQPVGIDGVIFDNQCLEQLYGPWPGPLPEPPPLPTPVPTDAVPSPSPSR